MFSSSHISDRHACLSGQASPALGVWVLVVSAFVYGKPKALQLHALRASAKAAFEQAGDGLLRIHRSRVVRRPWHRKPFVISRGFCISVPTFLMDKKTKNMSSASHAEDRKNSSVDSFRVGDVWCNIFAFTNKNAGTYHRFTLSRSYRDNKGTWKRTQFYGPEDADSVASVVMAAADKIRALE